jgi:hypothetical protein
MFVSEFLRIYDLVAIAFGGVLGYAFYVWPGPGGVNRYPGTIILGSLVAAIICHICGAYRVESVFSRSLGANRAVIGWLAAFTLILVAAFALKFSESYSRVWATIWLVSGTGFLLVGRTSEHLTMRLAKQGASPLYYDNRRWQAARRHSSQGARRCRARIVGFVDDQGCMRDLMSFHGIL